MSLSKIVLLVTLLIYQVTAFSNQTLEEIPDTYLNLAKGNALWTSLITNCRKPSLACVEKNMYNYLQNTLDYPKDFHITSFLKFTKNQLDYNNIVATANQTQFNQEDDINDVTDDKQDSPFERMSRSLHDKSIEFLMTHDMELQLPETIFQGTTLKLSPRSFEETGALMKLEFLPPKQDETEVEEGRIFFKKIKNFKKFVSEKLIWALLAILLVIKLLAAKFLFFLPTMVGAVAAKKLLIKVLLFLFPALHHIFKFCPYVPHGTKYHHHKHQIAHIHHVGPGGHGHGHGHGHGPPPSLHHPPHGPHHSVEVIAPHADGPPILKGGPTSFHHFVDHDPPHKPSYNPHEQELEYYSGGAALSHHFINSRYDETQEDDNEVKPWGQGQGTVKKKPISLRPFTVPEIENMVIKAEKEHLLKNRLQQERLKIQEENARLQEQLKQAMRMQDKLRQKAAVVQAKVAQQAQVQAPPQHSQHQPQATSHNPPSAAPLGPAIHQQQANYYPKPQQHQQQQQQRVQQTQTEAALPAAQIPKKEVTITTTENPKKSQQTSFEEALHQAATITYDPFYSPILEKIDNILKGLGFNEEPCRERLICSMYKNPAKFSPHSNLLSAELSRDSNELQKPKTTNAAVIRFYRYVQAARDGQDKRECLRLYPACVVNTEQ